jgi:hypothetical protein
MRPNTEEIGLLIEAGASLATADFSGETPFQIVRGRGLEAVSAMAAARAARDVMRQSSPSSLA